MKPGDLVRYYPLFSALRAEHDPGAIGIVIDVYSKATDHAGNSVKMAQVLWPQGLVTTTVSALQLVEQDEK